MAFLIERIHIENVAGRIRLRWSYQGEVYPLSLGLDYTEENISKAQIKRAEIYSDIISDNFDRSLEKYREDIRQAIKPGGFSLLNMFDYWVLNILKADLLNNSNYYGVKAMLVKWGLKNTRGLPDLLNAETWAPSTYNRRLRVLTNYLTWLCKKGYIKSNPLLEISRKTDTSEKRESRKPMKPEEIVLFLDAVKTDKFKKSRYSHSYYYPFFYTIFRTGMRNQEIIGLPVKNVLLTERIIIIDTVLARCEGKSYKRRAKEPKANKIRYIPIPEDLVEVLLPLIINKEPSALVFTSYEGKIIDDKNLQNRIFYPILKKLNIPKRDLYAARQSFGSRAIEQGMSLLQTSELMGNSPQVLLKYYAQLLYKPVDLPTMQ